MKLNKQGVPVTNFGDISGKQLIMVRLCVERLELKKQMNCKPFSWYVERFQGRAWCLTSSGVL